MNRDSSSTLVLSAEARVRARAEESKMGASRRHSRRLSIQQSLAGILGDEDTEDWGTDDGIQSVFSQQSGKSCQSNRTTGMRYQRRGSVTKYSLDDTSKSTSIISTEARATDRVEESKMGASRRHSRRLSIQQSLVAILGDEDTEDWGTDDGMRSVSSQQSGKSCQSNRTTGMRYQRRGSVTKYSLDDTSKSTYRVAESKMKSDRSYQDNGNTTNVPTSSITHSRGSSSSFADVAPQCTSIDSLPLPMKKKSSTKMKRRGSKKARDSISKYSSHSVMQDTVATDAYELSSDMMKTEKSTVAENNQLTMNDIVSPLRKKTKKKKELKHRKGQEELTSIASTCSTSKKRNKQKRRCSVTKYNLPQELEQQYEF